MNTVSTFRSIAIDELQQVPEDAFESAARHEEPLCVTSSARVVGYIIPPALMAHLQEYMEDRELVKTSVARMNDEQMPLRVKIDDL